LLLATLGILGWTGWKSRAENKTIRQSTEEYIRILASTPPVAAQTGTPSAALPPLTAEQKLQLQNSVSDARVQLLTEIRAADANERATLDKLILFVGGYSAILGLMAFGTVNLVRKDAEDQMARIEKNVVKFEDQTKKSLDDLTEDTEKKLVKFQKEIWNELPQMRNLQTRLANLLRGLAQTVPSESDPTSRSSYRNLSEKKRQEVLVAEYSISALRNFIEFDKESKATLGGLYRALARFYAGRYLADERTGDAERADIYALYSLDIEPNSAGIYRVRGTTSLWQYRKLPTDLNGRDSARNSALRNGMLADAAQFLEEALRLDENDVVAACNLVIALNYRKSFDEAIEHSRKMLGRAETVSLADVKSYFPKLYVNLACSFANKCKLPDQTDEQRLTGLSEATTTIREGYAFFRKLGAEDAIRAMRIDLGRELEGEGDLAGLNSAQQDELRGLFVGI